MSEIQHACIKTLRREHYTPLILQKWKLTLQSTSSLCWNI